MSYQDEQEIAAWLLEPTPRRSHGGPADWGLGRLRVVDGGPPPVGRGAVRLRELEARERAVSRREMRVTVTGYMVACALAVECLLALLVVGWGNHRLPAPLPSATTTGAR